MSKKSPSSATGEKPKSSKDPLPEIKKAIASLRPEEQKEVRRWLNSNRQRSRRKPKSSVVWPDFRARRKAIFGDRVLPDSQAVLDEVRADRF